MPVAKARIRSSVSMSASSRTLAVRWDFQRRLGSQLLLLLFSASRWGRFSASGLVARSGSRGLEGGSEVCIEITNGGTARSGVIGYEYQKGIELGKSLHSTIHTSMRLQEQVAQV